jgi:hypothetical protein
MLHPVIKTEASYAWINHASIRTRGCINIRATYKAVSPVSAYWRFCKSFLFLWAQSCRTAPAETQRRGRTFGVDGGSTILQSQITGSTSQLCGPKGTLKTRNPVPRPNTNIRAANTNRCKKHLAVWAKESLRSAELNTLTSDTAGAVSSASQTALWSPKSTPRHSTRIELLISVWPSRPNHSTRIEYVKTAGFPSHAMPS